MRCVLLAVMLLMVASMKTMKEIGQALSMDGSFFDQGLGGDDLNLQVIESSLMSMVREGTSPSLRPGIMAIYDLTTDMKAAVENKSSHEQTNLTQAWNDWLACSLIGDRNNNNFSTKILDEVCVVTDTTGLVDWDGNPFNGSVTDWYATHCRQNCTQVCEYESEITAQSCPQTPFSCEKQWAAFDDNTDVRAHMVYLQSVFAANSLIETNCSTNTSNCTSRCVTECPGAYNSTNTNCSQEQCRLENEGCKSQTSNCAEYQSCWYEEQEDYNQTKNYASAQEQSNKAEYRAVLRIECLLTAFLDSIDNNESLSVGIDGCINTTFDTNNQTLFGNVSITYYNESLNPLKECTTENFPNSNPPLSLVPGSQAWQDEYYAPYTAAGITPPVCADDPSLAALIPDCSTNSTR